MSRPTFFTIALLLSAAFAGCVSDESGDLASARQRAGQRVVGAVDETIPTDWFELAIPMATDHNHRDAKQHQNLSTSNFEILGYDPLITDYYGRTAGDYFCGDVKEKDGRKLSVVHSWGSDVAFVLADVTDPKRPEKVGELVMANTQTYDVALTPDFNFVAISTSPFDSGPDNVGGDEELRTITWRDACTGDERPLQGPESSLPYATGVVLVDISNPRNPVVVDFRQLPVIGSHSVQASTVKGSTIITVSVDNAVSTVSYYIFFRIMGSPAGGKLVPISVYSYVPENQQSAAPSFGVHMDGYVTTHPVTNRATAFLAYRGVGFIMVDMEDPSRPQFLSRWAPFPVGIHSVVALKETWDGRHYTILGEECGGPNRGNPTCLIFVIDTTDPRAPKMVASWTLPLMVQWRQGLQFSVHYYDLVGRTLFVSTYHGGMWAVDLAQIGKTSGPVSLPSIGVFIPALESPKPIPRPQRSALGQALFTAVGTNIDDRPTVLDIVATSDGNLVTWDALSGVYVVRFDADRPAPAPEPWPIKGIGLA